MFPRYFHFKKTDIKTSNAQREHLQSEKNTLEQELVKSQETLDDLQLELQQARMINTAPAENIEGQGNSLFSEVEDQRKKTASELNILTSTYKDKIAKFDTMEAEIEKLRNENTNLKFQLSSMVVSGELLGSYLTNILPVSLSIVDICIYKDTIICLKGYYYMFIIWNQF